MAKEHGFAKSVAEKLLNVDLALGAGLLGFGLIETAVGKPDGLLHVAVGLLGIGGNIIGKRVLNSKSTR